MHHKQSLTNNRRTQPSIVILNIRNNRDITSGLESSGISIYKIGNMSNNHENSIESSFQSYMTEIASSEGYKKIQSRIIKKTKRKKKIKIVHPLFLQCAEVTKDPYWASVFIEAAKGKFPRGFSFKNGILQYIRKTKKNIVDIPSMPTEARSLCIDFFQTYGRLRSPEDYIRESNARREKLLENTGFKSWSDIKKNSTKKLLLENYINWVSKKLDLDKKRKEQLITCVNLGLLEKRLKPVDILLKNGIISSINGLFHDLVTGFSIDPSRKGVKKSIKDIIPEEIYLDPAQTIEKIYIKNPNLTKLWKKRADNLNKESSVVGSSNINYLNVRSARNQTFMSSLDHDGLSESGISARSNLSRQQNISKPAFMDISEYSEDYIGS